MGFNWPKVATIKPKGTTGCIVYIIDIFKELKLKISICINTAKMIKKEKEVARNGQHRAQRVKRTIQHPNVETFLIRTCFYFQKYLMFHNINRNFIQ